MELQLKNTLQFVLLVVVLSCSKINNVEGNWGALDEKNNYSELFFETEYIRVYSEIGGIISPLTYFVENDSLFTNILNYKIIKLNRDSLILESESTILNLKRIKKGFKLSDYTNENLEDKFKDAFYIRMFNRKGLEPKNRLEMDFIPHSIKEETFEIKR